MKKLINAPDAVVEEALDGMTAAHGDLIRVHRNPNFITRADAPVRGKTALLSGGGSGHEPMHGGFVGRGMLDAACPGAVFTSPTPDQMLEASKAVNGGAGILHIVKNYTGDVMNFEMAADLARAEGIDVESVVIDDDVAVKDSTWTAGRRGVATTVLAEKICGGAAEARMPLAPVADLCRREDEMEIGIGIHGEPGRHRVKLENADRVAEMLLEPILEDLPFKSGDNVLLFVNGMGGTPQIELYIVYRKAYEIAAKHGLKVVRNLVGSYVTILGRSGGHAIAALGRLT
eukprot:gene14528-17630_t